MLDVELRDALARHARTLDERAPAITVDELDARPVAVRARRPRRTVVRVAVALTVVVAIVVAVAVFRGTPDATTPAALAGPDAKQISKYHWSYVPISPAPGRMDAATVWTGHEVIEWGGTTGGPGGAVSNIGTAYDPSANTWRVIAPAPLSPRRDATSVWTGRQMFVWGGTGTFEEQTVSDGALYDPSTNEWRMLPPSPLGGRSAAQAFWTGKKVLVVGGTERVGGRDVALVDAAMYDVGRNQWHRISEVPQPETRRGGFVVASLLIRAVWIGDRLLAWQYLGAFSHDPDTPPSASGIRLLSYSPTSNRWRVVENENRGPRSIYAPIWTGDEVIIPGASWWDPRPGYHGVEHGATYSPRTDRWRRLPTSPMNDAGGPAVWTGRVLVALNTTATSVPNVVPVGAAALDPRRNRWFPIGSPPPSIPSQVPAAVWTGREMVVPDVLVGLAQNDGHTFLLEQGGLRLGP